MSSKILISPAEPREIKNLLSGIAISHALPEQYGADFLLFTPRGRVGVQRKTYPDDLLNSLRDGRLAKEIAQLQQLEYHVLLLEGDEPVYTSDGTLMSAYQSSFTKTQIRNILRSIQQIHGIPIERTFNHPDTVETVLAMHKWFSKEVHNSLFHRPKGENQKNQWGVTTSKDTARHFLQGFPGIGPGIAEAIYNHFQRIPLDWACTVEQMTMVPGIGPKRAKALFDMLKV